MGYPLEDSSKMEDAKNYIVNILKMEGYKLNSGELFVAFTEAGGEMSDFKDAFDELESEIIDDNEDDLESIIKLKEETDSWLIEKLKNNGTDDSLRDEVKELKERVAKLEKIISNLTRAFD